MPKDSRVYFEDMLTSIEKVKRYVGSLTFEQFAHDEMRVDAVIRNLEVMGEAARSIPPEVRERYPSIEWRKVVGLRNILIHEYSGVDIEILWDIVKAKLPQLEREVRRALGRE